MTALVTGEAWAQDARRVRRAASSLSSADDDILAFAEQPLKDAITCGRRRGAGGGVLGALRRWGVQGAACLPAGPGCCRGVPHAATLPPAPRRHLEVSLQLEREAVAKAHESAVRAEGSLQRVTQRQAVIDLEEYNRVKAEGEKAKVRRVCAPWRG